MSTDRVELLDYLFQLTMQNKWELVVEFYKTHSWAHKAKLTKSEETALHVAVSSCHAGRTGTKPTYIKKMIECLHENEEFVLSMKNDKGNTLLHLAATVGSVEICAYIFEKCPDLITIRNSNGETPLFTAARHGNTNVFIVFHKLYNAKVQEEIEIREEFESLSRRNHDGNTILHIAISGAYFNLAYQIICHYPYLVNSVNVDGESPIHVLAKKPNVFKSSSHLGFYDSIIYHCLAVDELKIIPIHIYESRRHDDVYDDCINVYPNNYRTCANIFRFICIYPIRFLGIPMRSGANVTSLSLSCLCKNYSMTFMKLIAFLKLTNSILLSSLCSGGRLDEENQQYTNGRRYYESQIIITETSNDDGGSFPANYATCISIFKFAAKAIIALFAVGMGFLRVVKIREKKQRYSNAVQVMNRMIELTSSNYKYKNDGMKPTGEMKFQFLLPSLPMEDEIDESGGNRVAYLLKNETPILVASKMGIPEMVETILNECPVAIQDLDSNGKNVLMLAAETRQIKVLEYLLIFKPPENMFNQVDNEGNSILHLAAKLTQLHPWRTSGLALQMQLELKWYQFVKNSVPRLSFASHNKNGDTPKQIFTTTHEILTKDVTRWLTKTSESCSLIAALIATVAFATASTVPGGVDNGTGHPILRDHSAFHVFSISSVIALCLSVTALVFFLSIITSRCQQREFKENLPWKLLMGLTTLFASLAAMALSFFAGHLFILKKNMWSVAFPLYSVACAPLTFFVIAKLPLYFDLLLASFKKVPLNRSNTVPISLRYS